MKTYQIAQPLDLTGQVCKEPSHYTPTHSAEGGAEATPHRWLTLHLPAGSLLTFDDMADNGPDLLSRCAAAGWEA